MLNKIAEFFKAKKSGTRSEDLEEQIRIAEQLRDTLGVARKVGLTVVMTIEVGNVRQGVLLAGDSAETRWLYDFACGEVFAKKAERLTDAKFGLDWKGRV